MARVENIILDIIDISHEEYCKIETLCSWDDFKIGLISSNDPTVIRSQFVEDVAVATYNWKKKTVFIDVDDSNAWIQPHTVV